MSPTFKTNHVVFKNVRLVCRLRKSSPARAPILASASSSAVSSSQTLVSDVAPPASVTPLPEKTMEGGEPQSADDTPLSSSTPAQTPTNRYFIMKSLTKEDLSWSVNNKVWATQPHNESILNDAFKVPSCLKDLSYNGELRERLPYFQCQ